MTHIRYNSGDMRYCLIGPTYPYRGGIAHYTTLLAQQLRRDHEVLLLSFSRQYPAWLFPGESDKDPSKRPLQTEAEYILNPLNPVSWGRTLRRMRQWQPDVVIMQWWHPYFAPVWSMISRAVKRMKPACHLVFICHNVLPHERGSRLGQMVQPVAIKLALAKADRFLVHSQADGRLLNSFFPRAAYQVTPLPTYGALGASIQSDLPIVLPDDRPILLFCGFIRPYKGLDILLDALALVVQERPLHLLVAGEFWQGGKDQYRAQIKRLNLDDAVTLLDQYIPDEWLSRFMEQANVVVLPYRSATQSGIIQLAFGYNRPVITTNVGGLSEAVRHNHTGLVVPPEEPHALAQAIICFFEEELEAVFTRNIEEENGRFSWNHLVQALNDNQS
jgi:glycosyltransferase involved in cell wall biosynthesis